MLCDNWDTGLAQGEIEVGLKDGDLGVGRRVCGRNEVGLAVGGYAIVETENLYGRIVGTGTLHGSWAVSERVELFASIEGLRYEMLIAPISSNAIGPGYTDLGASGRIVDGERMGVALHGKLVLPTAFTIDQGAYPTAADLGVSMAWNPVDPLVIHGSAMGMFGMALGGGPLFPRGGAQIGLGAEWKPTKGFGLVLDSQAGFGYTDAIDVVAVGGGVRGAIGKHAGLSLVADVPVAGRERALAAFDLRFDWRL